MNTGYQLSNRSTAWDDFEYVLQHEPLHTSYLYEVSESGFPNPSDSFSWAQLKESERVNGVELDYKRVQGQDPLYPNYTGPAIVPPNNSQMPSVRCFHHYDWSSGTEKNELGADKAKYKLVNNLSMDCGRVFQGRPYWPEDLAGL